MDDTTIILKATNLTIGYERKVIQPNLNLQLARGELVCLLGQNGVGKSTLMKTLTSLIPALAGNITINKKPIQSITKSELASLVGIVTTDKITAPGLSVMDVLMTGRYPYQSWLGQPKQADFLQIQKACDQTRTNYLLRKKMQELSDGQRQKVMIARALVQDSQIIVLDEPTAHLDLNNRLEIMKLLQEIVVNQNKSLLIATHEITLALQFSDQLWLMDYGKPIVTGTPEDLAVSNVLNKIYHHSDFNYDLKTGRITNATSNFKGISIRAATDLKFWIRNALERVNLKIGQEVTITADLRDNELNWVISFEGNTYKGVRIAELIKQLSKFQQMQE